MANYRTCHNCAVDRNACEVRRDLAAALVGLHVTSVKFGCKARVPLHRPGDRVTVTWVVPEYEDQWEREASEESWPATVVQEKGGKFIICVDDADSDNGTPARSYIKSDSLYCKVSAGKLSPLQEPSREVCALCGIIAPSEFYGCWQSGSVPDKRCLREISRLSTPPRITKEGECG